MRESHGLRVSRLISISVGLLGSFAHAEYLDGATSLPRNGEHEGGARTNLSAAHRCPERGPINADAFLPVRWKK